MKTNLPDQKKKIKIFMFTIYEEMTISITYGVNGNYVTSSVH